MKLTREYIKFIAEHVYLDYTVTELAEKFKVSRQAVLRIIADLRRAGLPIEKVPNIVQSVATELKEKFDKQNLKK